MKFTKLGIFLLISNFCFNAVATEVTFRHLDKSVTCSFKNKSINVYKIENPSTPITLDSVALGFQPANVLTVGLGHTKGSTGSADVDLSTLTDSSRLRIRSNVRTQCKIVYMDPNIQLSKVFVHVDGDDGGDSSEATKFSNQQDWSHFRKTAAKNETVITPDTTRK